MSASEPLMTHRNTLDDVKTSVGFVTLGQNSEETCLLSEWHPVERWHELNLGFCVERGNLSS